MKHVREKAARIQATLAALRAATGLVDAGAIADALAAASGEGPLLVGVTGSVAAGKTTFSRAVAGALSGARRVDVISTDGFLLPNETLLARGLIMRKGFPESYDGALMSAVLRESRVRAVIAPGYSHVAYDRAADQDRIIDRPDVLIVEGLGFAVCDDHTLVDLLIYLDAAEADLQAWFVTRFMAFWRAAEREPTSFYARFRLMPEAEAEAFARQVWTEINLPNLRDHIAPLRDLSDIVITKAADHSLRLERVG